MAMQAHMSPFFHRTHLPRPQQECDGVVEVAVSRLYVDPLVPHGWLQDREQEEAVDQQHARLRAPQLLLRPLRTGRWPI